MMTRYEVQAEVERLKAEAERLTTFWRNKGFNDVKFFVIPEKTTDLRLVWGIRSNLVRGLPPRGVRK